MADLDSETRTQKLAEELRTRLDKSGLSDEGKLELLQRVSQTLDEKDAEKQRRRDAFQESSFPWGLEQKKPAGLEEAYQAQKAAGGQNINTTNYLNEQERREAGIPPMVEGPKGLRKTRMLGRRRGYNDQQAQEVEEGLRQLVRDHIAGATDLFKKAGLPKMPRGLGDWLYGLVLCTELEVSMQTEVTSDLLEHKVNHRDQVMHDVREVWLQHYHISDRLIEYGIEWREYVYPRVAVGHKLASALMLTDANDMEVKAPWDTWVLELPDGLHPFSLSPSKFREANARGDKVFAFNLSSEDPDPRGDEKYGQVRGYLCQGSEPVLMILEADGYFTTMKLTSPENVTEADTRSLVDNYVKGVCLAFHDRKHVRESHWARSAGASKKRKKKEPGKGRHYLLSTPIEVDFRDEIREMLSGRKRKGGGIKKVQWKVRGHWRNQACGPGMQDHRPTWIQPYWKGPEGARVLLRGHHLK